MNEKLESISNITYERSNSIINSIQVKNQEQLKKIIEIQKNQNNIDKKIEDLNELVLNKNNMLNQRINELNEIQKQSNQNIEAILQKNSKDNKRRFWIVIGILIFIAVTV